MLPFINGVWSPYSLKSKSVFLLLISKLAIESAFLSIAKILKNHVDF